MNILNKAKLNLNYRELRDLKIDDKLLSEILDNKDFLSVYKKEFREFIIDLSKAGINKDVIRSHVHAVYELHKSNNASKYIEFIRKNGFENRVVRNINVFKDENFIELYNLIGYDIFSDNISEVIDKGYGSRLLQYKKNNPKVDLNKINVKFFGDKMWNVISQNPYIGDKTTLELFGRKMDILSEIVEKDYFEGLKYTYENISESRRFIESDLGNRNTIALEQFSMEFIQNIGVETLSELYRKSSFLYSQEFEKIFQICSYGNYDLIKDLVSYDRDVWFRNVSLEDMSKSLIEASIGNYNKSELVLNKYFGIERKDMNYLPLFLETINKTQLSFEFKEKYETILELLNKLYTASDEEIISIAQALDKDSVRNYEKLIFEMERDGNELVKQQFSKNLLEKTSQIENVAKHSVVNSNGKNIDVYELNGHPFTMLVHNVISNSMSSNNDIAEKILENPRLFNEINGGNNFISTSLISDKAMITYGVSDSRGTSITFGFDNVPPENIKYTFIGDAGTNRKLDGNSNLNMRDQGISSNINTVGLVDDIITKTAEINNRTSAPHGKYNEILLKRVNENERLKPSYIVCFDRINDIELKAASELNIPIYLIDRKYYYSYVERMQKHGLDITIAESEDFARTLKVS